MRTLSAKNSTGYVLLAWMPPTFAAAKMTPSGFSSRKNALTERSSVRSSSLRSRTKISMSDSVAKRRQRADPTMPRWPAMKTRMGVLGSPSLTLSGWDGGGNRGRGPCGL